MISVTKGAKPQILTAHEVEWRDNLLAIVSQYGSYSDIPRNVKEAALRPYAHADIKQALGINDAKAKCAFCETIIRNADFPEIEHYHPKSLYPEEAFSWDNFVVACSQCNNGKDNYDTKNEPFINPTTEDPELLITYRDSIPVPRSSDPDICAKVDATVDACGLRRGALVNSRASVQISFLTFEEDLRLWLREYNALSHSDAKRRRVINMARAIDGINNLAQSTQPYAGFVRHLIRNSEPIKQALPLVKNHRADDLKPEFAWCFGYDL